MPPSHGKRLKTRGENEFDLATYGGAALLGNEAASLVITKAIDPGNLAHGWHRKFAGWFEGLGRFKNSEGKPILARYIVDPKGHSTGARLPFLLVATLGGMLMVPIVKYLEDHKGPIVRWLDRKHYGVKAESDPAIVAAHKEMDEAPQQSWSSLGWGRLTTVTFAALGDYAFGWKDALTTRLAKGTKFEPYSSLDAIANRTEELAKRWFKVSAKTGEWVQQGTWLLTLSTTLTALFYISSKLFARKRDEKIERKEYAKTHPGAPTRDEAEAEPDQPAPSTPERPSPQITNVTRENTVAADRALAPSV